MAGSAAAASVGARCGAEHAQAQIRANNALRSAQQKKRSEDDRMREKALIERLLKKFDTDGSKSFDDGEIKNVLSAFSAESFEMDETPTADDLLFLKFLIDDQGGKARGDGVFKGKEIIAVLDIWSAYLERIDWVKCLLQDFDIDKSGRIEPIELPALLHAVRGRPLPDDVLQWIFDQSNITRRGALNGLEIARATVCYYRWADKTDPIGDARRLKGYITVLPDLSKPVDPSCCIVA